MNAGVAEANMISMAGALAATGLNPWVYSIAPFATVRCLEQIRNDVCYERRKVNIVGIGGGYSYGTLGPTHHALEDASLLAALPEVVVCTPSNACELDHLFALLAADPRPVYWRLDREDGPAVECPPFGLDAPVVRYREGRDGTLVTAGSILASVLAAAEILEESGIRVSVVSLPVVAPDPSAALAPLLGAGPALAVFEGFTGNPVELAVLRAAVLAGPRKVGRADAGRAFARTVGNTGHLRAQAGLDPAGIAAAWRALG